MRSYPRTAFVNQFNYKNATAFFTNAFKRKAALNKWSLSSNFVLVYEIKRKCRMRMVNCETKNILTYNICKMEMVKCETKTTYRDMKITFRGDM